MSKGAIVFGLVISIALIATAGVLNMLARSSGEAALRDAVVLVTDIRQVFLEPETGSDSSAVSAAVVMSRFAEGLGAGIPAVPDMPEGLAHEIVSLADAVRQRQGAVETFLEAHAALSEAAGVWRSSAKSLLEQAEAIDDEVLASAVSTLLRDMNLFLDGAGGAPNLEALQGGAEFADSFEDLASGAVKLVAGKEKVDGLLELATPGDIAGLSERLVISLETEHARRQLLVRIYDSGMAAALGVLVLFWILLGLLQGGRAPPFRRLEEGERPVSDESRSGGIRDERYLVRSVAAAIASRAERIADRTNALRQSRLKLKDALEETSLDRALHDGVPLREGIEAMDAILGDLRNETGELSSLGKRLEGLARAITPAADLDTGTVDINTCLDEALEVTGAGHTAHVAKHFSDVPGIRGVRFDIVLALTRIIDNAIDAVSGLEDREGAIRVATAAGNGEIRVTITDNGNAAKPDLAGNTFRQAGTSRDGAPERALTLACGLIGRHGGAMRIESRPGQGTTARVSFPTEPAPEA